MRRTVKAGLITVAITRDHIARELLKELHVEAEVMADPAFFCPPLSSEQELNIVGYRGIGLGPREPMSSHVRRAGGPSANLDQLLRWAWDRMREPKVAVVHDNREIKAADELFDGRVYYSSDASDLYRLYSRCRYYVGSRIHGFVPTLVHGAPAHLIYPTDKAVMGEVAIRRLDLKRAAQVSIMGRDRGIKPILDLEQPVRHRAAIDRERQLFRKACLGVDWLRELMV